MSKVMPYKVNLNEPVIPQAFKSPLYAGEKQAHTIRAEISPASYIPANAECEGYFIYTTTQQTVAIPAAKCSYSNGVAEVTLTDDCYALISQVSFIMTLATQTENIVVLSLFGKVNPSWTDNVVEAGDLDNIPDLPELITAINALNHVDINSSKTGDTITIVTTNKNGTTVTSTITDPSGNIATVADTKLYFGIR